MAIKIDLTNQRFGRLNVIRDSKERAGYGHIIWLCKCSCGKQVKVISGNLRYGHTRSCGCLNRERTKAMGKASLRHGEDQRSRLYTAWINLKRKCYNRNAIIMEVMEAGGLEFVKNGGIGRLDIFLSGPGP